MDDQQKKKDTLFEIHRENIYFRWGLTAFIVVVACIIAAQFITKMPAFFGYVKAFLRTLSPVLYGLGIAYLLHPIEDRIRKLLEPQLCKLLPAKKAAGMAKGHWDPCIPGSGGAGGVGADRYGAAPAAGEHHHDHRELSLLL